jgi:hypothetical protein
MLSLQACIVTISRCGGGEGEPEFSSPGLLFSFVELGHLVFGRTYFRCRSFRCRTCCLKDRGVEVDSLLMKDRARQLTVRAEILRVKLSL